ncbi:MAG TPA: hypothetical protein PKE31_14280 [Pseudomonadota bacterium]|nr:hypothetical protein [Pseudomonadota bacterium]
MNRFFLTKGPRVVPGILVVSLLSMGGCATTQYSSQLVARGELLLSYDGGFVMQAGGKKVAQGLSYRGLERFVSCVPEAKQHARSAQRHGGAAIALSVLGISLSVASLGSLAGLGDSDHMWAWLGGGLATGAVGLTLSSLSWREKNQANGHALDALNYYNDAVGSLGATCQDLAYPPPAGPLPSELPPPPSVPSSSSEKPDPT